MKCSNSSRASTVWRVIRTWQSTLTLRPSRPASARRTEAPSTPSFSRLRTRRQTEAAEAPTLSAERGVAEARVALQRANDSPVDLVKMKFFTHDLAIS